MAKVVRVPITNVHMGGDYTGRIYVGPENTPLNVILDTGSSALAVDGKKYKPTLSGTGADKTTRLAQTDAYGDGSSWTGAVLDATVTIGDGAQAVPLAGANVSVAYTASRSMFDGADGILGLAYAPLDDAFKMPKNTWTSHYTATQVRTGKGTYLTPYLTQLAQEGITSDVISFYTLRSFTHIGGPADDPLNSGWMIIGGGEESKDLYSGKFQSVKVVSDDWYSTNMKSVIVGNSSPIAARRQGPKNAPSNSIVDSGTNSIDVSQQMFDGIASKLTSGQRQLLKSSVLDGQDVSVSDLKLAAWPALTFVLEGDDGSDVRLKVAPTDYWQVNTDEVGKAAAAITIGDPGFTILGLPLMNGYFTIFDGEAAGGKGVIKFAHRK
jgi:aspartyl protease